MSYFNILITVLVSALLFNIFIAGIYLGKIFSISENDNHRFAPGNKSKQNNNLNKPISIDDTKVVLDINTTNLEKKFTEIADTQTSEIDISESINKLKTMKG